MIGRKGRRRVSVLFDSGSSFSMIREDLAREIGEPDDLPEPVTCHAAVGSFEAREGVFVNLKLRTHHVLASMTVVPNLTEDVIIGADFLQRRHIKLDPFRRRVIVHPEELKLRA